MTAECYEPLAIAQALLQSDSLSTECLATLKSSATRTDVSFGFYVLIFLITCLFEAPIYLIAGKLLKRSNFELLKQIFVLNLATHPIVFWVMPILMQSLKQNTLTLVAVSESFAPIVEALLLRFWAKYSWGFAIATAFAANVFSWWFGLWVQSHGLL